MSKINYEIREDGTEKMIVEDPELGYLDIDEVLESYPYIADAMKKEKFSTGIGLCTFFKEIVYEKTVVGFATYQITDNYDVLLVDCYILPEFRGKHLFFNELCTMILSSPNFGILKPTHDLVELLIEFAFAKKINDEIVVSGIDFYLDHLDVHSNKSPEFYEDELEPSNFYDLSVCSTILILGDEIIYHEPLFNDLTKFGERKELSEDYFNNIKKLFSVNQSEFENLIIELKNELPQENLGFDEIIGHGDSLTAYVQGMVDSDLISYDDAMKLKKQLKIEYDSGVVPEEYLDDRLCSIVFGGAPIYGDYNDFKKEIYEHGIETDETKLFKEFFNMIGDNLELGNKMLSAIAIGNEEALENMVLEVSEDNESFFEEFTELGNDELGYDEESIREYVIDWLENKFRLGDISYENGSPNYIWERYQILKALDYGDNYYDALNGINLESLVSPGLLTDLLLESNFIKKEGIIEIDWLKDSSKFPKPYLKKILYDNGLEIEGSKKELLKRLADNNVSLGDAYKITSKGKNYLKEFAWISFYDEFFTEFDFIDFYKYLDSHNGNIKEVSLKYLDEHLKLAIQRNDEFYFEECIYVKNEILEEADEFLSGLNIPE